MPTVTRLRVPMRRASTGDIGVKTISSGISGNSRSPDSNGP